jgi:extradiol dioxygenase family protein
MTADTRPPFHLAFPVNDLLQARHFYAGLLGCPVGRESERWIDFDFFGHQITAHLSEPGDAGAANPVDGDAVPVRHFGAVLPWAQWQDLAARLARDGLDFLIQPRIRFAGQAGEQGTFFIRDPAGNALEFKSFRDPGRLFARA